MTLRNLIYVSGVAALIFVLGDLFAAAQMANLLGGSLDAFGVGLVQVRGGVGLLYVFLAYFSRNSFPSCSSSSPAFSMRLPGFLSSLELSLFLPMSIFYTYANSCT